MTHSQGVQVRGKYKEMEDLRKQEESRQQRIIKAKEDLAAAVTESETLPIYEPPKEVLVSLTFQPQLAFSSGDAWWISVNLVT